MQSIFGIPMTGILVAVVAITALCLAATALIALRNRVVFRMAVRNVPRRRTQSVLIMTGLMLSTALTTAALVTGDTLDGSLTASTYVALGEVDEVIAFADSEDGGSDLTVTSPTFPASVVEELDSRLRANADPAVEAVMPVLTIGAPVTHPGSGLSEPVTVVTGLDPARVSAFGGLRTASGGTVDLGALPPGATVIAEELAEAIQATEGDELTLYVEGEPHHVTVAAVVPGSILTGYAPTEGNAGPGSLASGDLLGMAVPLVWLQELTGMAGQARFIAVSNPGGVESGAGGTDAALAALRDALGGIEGASSLGVSAIKADALASAEAFGSTFTGLFLVFGLFSVAAGVLLIFLIFAMLAAERRSEMGIARAIGMTRSELVQGFIVEGAVYDLGAAFLGATVGVALSLAATQLLGSIFGEVSITPTVTATSLIVAYALGVSVTFATVIVAATRASRLNIIAAIRDLPGAESVERGERPRWRWWQPLPLPRRRALAAVRLAREVPWNVLSFLPRLLAWPVRAAAYAGGKVLTMALGTLILALGVVAQVLALFALGLSLLVLGLAVFLRRFLPARPVFTIAAALMLLYWSLPPDVTDAVLPPLDDGGPEMLFVAGAFMVTYTTLILMWNVHLVVRLTSLLGRSSSRWVPAVKAAVAYPLASKGRTGLTIAMFSLVVFSAVTVRTINANFVELLLGEDADAGWDIAVTASSSNPIDDLRQALGDAGGAPDALAAVGRLDVVTGSRGQVRNAGSGPWGRYTVNGVDADFIAGSRAALEARAPGYDSDAAVWQAIRSGEPVAIVDANAFDPGGLGGDADSYRIPAGIEVESGRIPAFDLELRDPLTGRTETVTVVGIIDRQVSTLAGLFVADELLTRTYGAPDEQRFFVRLAPSSGLDDEAAAAEIEEALRRLGVQAVSIRAGLREQQSQAEGFFTLMQGFLGLGLLVGIAALGVISSRSVVERRQEIGVLRAIGFERSMISVAFVIESLVTAVLGVTSGAVLALVLSYNLVMGGALDGSAEFEVFVIPWGTVGFFVAVTLVAAVVMTWIPARQAAAVPIADALRYE